MSPKIAASAITIGIFFFTLIIFKSCNSNPIIGKWKSETSYPFMGKQIEEIEFTNDSEYVLGMKIKVNYEIEGNKIIVNDESGIGTVYEIIDKNTITSNPLGFKTVLKRIN